MYKFRGVLLTLLSTVCMISVSRAADGDNLTYGISRFYDNQIYGVVTGTTSKTLQEVIVPSARMITASSITSYYQVRGIGSQAFNNCEKLTDIIFNSEKLLRIDKQAFNHCIKLKSIIIPEYVREIGIGAFHECWNLASVTLSDSLRIIKGNAFEDCNKLVSIVFPYYFQGIGIYAFHNCSSLASVKFNNALSSVDSCAFLGCTSLKSIEFSSVKTIDRSAFRGCSSLVSAIFSPNLSSFGPYAFSGCTSLETVVFPESKTNVSIKNNGFENCSSLRSVEIHDNVFRIYDRAFLNCTSLPSVTLPSAMQGIGPSAFEGCAALDSVTALMVNPFKLEKDVFKGISPTCVLMVPYGRRAAYIAAGWTEEVFKGGVKEIIPAGISQVKANTNAKEAGCYDLQGRKIQEPQKGLNIIRYKDGTTRKVMK